MNRSQRHQGFRAMMKDNRNSSHFFEEIDGELRTWKDLSPAGKLSYIARDAALCATPFKVFAEAVRESIATAAIEEAALGTVLRNAHEQLSLAKLLPPDGRLESTPLVDGFKELFSPSQPSRKEADRSTDREMEM